MIRSSIFCVLISFVTGKYNSYGINLGNLNESLQVASLNINSVKTYSDSVIFIGNTNSDKSTLINYLIGNKLKAVKKSPFEPLKIKVENESKGPEMGSGSQSKNIIPTKWTSKKLNGFTLWNTPDIDNNGEEIQDIIRSFYFFKLLQKVKSLKIILVLNIKDIIEDDAKKYFSLLIAVENIFGSKFEECFSSTSVIFTKVPNTINEIPVDYKYIEYHLENHFLDDPGLKWSQVSKNFTRLLLANSDRIALLKEMSHDGEITSDIDVNIYTAIKTSKIIPESSLQDLRPSISDSLKLHLNYSQEKLELELAIKEIAIILTEKIENYMIDIDNVAIKSNVLHKIAAYLHRMEDMLRAILNSGNNFEIIIKYLSLIDVNIKQKIEELRLLKNVKLIMFIESTLNINVNKSLESCLFDFSSLLLKAESLSSMIVLKSKLLMAKLERRKFKIATNELIQKISLLKKMYTSNA